MRELLFSLELDWARQQKTLSNINLFNLIYSGAGDACLVCGTASTGKNQEFHSKPESILISNARLQKLPNRSVRSFRVEIANWKEGITRHALPKVAQFARMVARMLTSVRDFYNRRMKQTTSFDEGRRK